MRWIAPEDSTKMCDADQVEESIVQVVASSSQRRRSQMRAAPPISVSSAMHKELSFVFESQLYDLLSEVAQARVVNEERVS